MAVRTGSGDDVIIRQALTEYLKAHARTEMVRAAFEKVLEQQTSVVLPSVTSAISAEGVARTQCQITSLPGTTAPMPGCLRGQDSGR